jgi:hypothetical protein
MIDSRYLIAKIATIATCGCSSTPLVEVRVPVPVPCVAADDVPQRPTITDAAVLRDLPDGRLVLTIASERAALAAYVERAAPLLDWCAR